MKSTAKKTTKKAATKKAPAKTTAKRTTASKPAEAEAVEAASELTPAQKDAARITGSAVVEGSGPRGAVLPVDKSGLTSIPADVHNPAYAIDTSK